MKKVMTNYRAEHVRETESASLEAAVRDAMHDIRQRGGRIVDLKIAPGASGRLGHAIVLYEIEDGSGAGMQA
jgi:hypothetical protein